MIKKMLCTVLAVSMILALFVVPVSADGVSVSDKKTTKIEAEAYSANYDPTTGDVTIAGSNPKYISYNSKEWVEYKLNVAKDGEYNFSVIAGVAAKTSVKLEISVDEKVVMNTELLETGGFNEFQQHNLGKLVFTKGEHTLKILNLGGGCHFDYITLSFFDPDADNSDISKQEGSYRTRVLPTIIEAEDFDLGKNSYVSLDGKNTNGAYRPDDGIDIKDNKKGNYSILLNAGEKTKYSFDVAISGAYTLYATSLSGGIIKTYIDGMPKAINKEIPANAEAEVATIYFNEGTHYFEALTTEGTLELDKFRMQSAEGKTYITVDSLLKAEDEEEVKEDYGVAFNEVYKELYVSPKGSDDNDGTKNAPFKTIKRAKEETVKFSADMTGDIIVNIEPGVYQISETEKFGVEHSGKNGFNIVYRGTDKDNQPIISGGEEISGWEKHTDKIWKAKADNFDDMRNLYINDFPAVRARSKYTYVHRGVYNDPETEGEYDGLYVDRLNFPESFEKPEDMEMVWFLEWVSTIIPIEDIIYEEGSDKVTIKALEPMFAYVSTIGQKQLNASVNKSFFLENAMELLDEPGEFYFDKDEKVVYYYPFERDNMENVTAHAAKVHQLVSVSGNSIYERAENITFDNIAFRYGAWDDPTETGFTSIQADQTIDVFAEDANHDDFIPDGQIDVKKASNVNFVGCDFACLGSTALTMIDAVSDSVVDGNLFRDLSGGAITVGTYDHFQPANTLIEKDMALCDSINITNNVIRRVSGEYRTLVPISVYYEKNINIIHNDIEDVPYSGITVGWGWGAAGPEGWGNIKINYNRVVDVMSSLKDGGNIYTLGPMKGSEIAYNYLSESRYVIAGVYTDSGSGYIDIHHNVIDDDYGTYWWYQGHNNTKELHGYNNYSTSETYRDAKSSNTLKDHTILKKNEWPKEAIDIKNQAGVLPEYSYLLEKGKAVEEKYTRNYRVALNAYKSDDDLTWIEAEDFKKGGQGIGYNKTTEYYGSIYRPNEAVGLMASPAGSGWVIDRNFPGEWFAYDVEVPKDGTYYFDFRAAHAWDPSVKPGINVYVDNRMVIENYLIPASPTWNDILIHNVGTLDLTEGRHVIKIEIVTNGFYIDALRVHDGSIYSAPKQTVNDAKYDECRMTDEADLMKVVEEINEGFADCVGHWAEDEITAMRIAGYAKGVSETDFAPDSFLTKKQAVLFAMRSTGHINNDAMWEDEARRLGLLEGLGNYDEPITREEFAKIIMILYKDLHGSYKMVVGEKDFKDVSDINPAYLEFVSAAKEQGFMTGDENKNFRPKSYLTRAEGLVVAKRLL